MKEDLKRKLADAFDKGLLEELSADFVKETSGDTRNREYLHRLLEIESGLKKPTEVEVPSGFVNTVLGRLPSKKVKTYKAFYLRDLFMPLFIFLVIVLSVVFADFFGLTKAMQVVSSSLENSDQNGMQFSFIILSSAGILFSTWLIISSFFGIKSRRISK